MKMLTVILWALWVIVGIQPAVAQRPASLFQPLTWEQAGLRAGRENKLVLVEVGTVDKRIGQKIEKNADLVNYLQRNVIAIRMDIASPGGKNFLPHLLMFEPPMYAFFMPYGDILAFVTPAEVEQNPSAIRETFEKAKKLADIKKSNSRSLRFESLPWQEGLAKAGKADKPLAVYVTADHSQPCLLLEKNILNLDEIADMYNRNFVNLRMNVSRRNEWTDKYAIREYPAFLFLNPEGKEIFRSESLQTREQVLEAARMALKKAQGLVFDSLTDQEAQQKAKAQHKLIFVEYYQPGNTHREMVRTVFTDPEVCALFEQHFINLSRETGQNLLVFAAADGRELHRVAGEISAEELLREARLAMADQGLASLERQYRQGQRQPEFLEAYMNMLARAGKVEEASRVAVTYFSALTPDCLRQSRYWSVFERYVLSADSDLFGYVLTNRKLLAEQYGEEQVKKKIAAIWMAGAENFVQDGVFDDTGFKEYTKRLKKEKVEGWRQIVRNARMYAAEKTGDWRTFVDLAEEKWNEEKISDAELYSWGVKIEQHCHDEAIRYKAARWFALAAEAMERKERLTGKIKLTSYKGFFEKLVNDLVGSH